MTIREEISSFYAGTSRTAYRFLGCHRSGDGFVFRLWAPNARRVVLKGDFNSWSGEDMGRNEGIWELYSENAKEYDAYKYSIETPSGEWVEKIDPYAFHTETRPANASRVYDIEGYEWGDGAYLSRTAAPYSAPVNIYEVHLGSWKVFPDGTPFSYVKLADELTEYVSSMGYTHVEFLPVTEYPLDDSWGYQVTGWYAPTSRYGTPKDFMYLIDRLHRAGVGVILDWVGAHFPKDSFGLSLFDGTPCYEDPDPVMAEHPEWGTKVFDYSRYEVRSFLTSSVCFWLDQYHVDGIRADAVASMLYLDYARAPGTWRPARDGGNINLDAVSFLRQMNAAAFAVKPNALMIAEESTAFPMVTGPVHDGGLGFGFKWNMGWMHDMLDYMALDPADRKYRHNLLTFSMTYAFSENYVLSISHDEVVHGKRSVMGRMFGSYEDRFRALRLLYAYMFAHPGKKLNFMGYEIAQFIEWDYHRGLDWFLLDYDTHREFREFIRQLNHFYLSESPLWEDERSWDGFRWLTVDDAQNSVVAFTRTNRKGDCLAAVFNFFPQKRENYVIGLPLDCRLVPVFSSDGAERPEVLSEKKQKDSFPASVSLELMPLSAAFYRVLPLET